MRTGPWTLVAVSLALLAGTATPRGAIAQTVDAQPAASLPSVFHSLEGEWVGDGTLLGRSAAFEMRWTIESATRARLEFKNGFLGPSGAVTPVLEAVAIYTVEPSGRIIARWTDDRPQEIDIAADASDSTLLSEWTAVSERGRTEYRVMADGSLRVRDWVRSGDALNPFGEARYARIR